MARKRQWKGLGDSRQSADPLEEYRKAARRIMGGEVKRGREMPDPFARIAGGQIHSLGDGSFMARSHGT